MALRIRRDVQKASYYVWFLGAEEAKGLRGARVINSVLPYLVDRSRCQEPLKVTLQVSHKGIKIVQGSSKHLIPHSAITSSVQTDDIVACVLLLYNPATKCPLHVHAYRCDSETTAEALHMQLQVLINRPDNQKRFEELETRLGILPPLSTPNSASSASSSSHNGMHVKSIHNDHSQSLSSITNNNHGKPHAREAANAPAASTTVVTGSSALQPHTESNQNRRHETSLPKSFNSSLGSDTGSELFDSLAAELRAKLNGNGPPLLLPPRDYDTVHRSKGNLTAIELRRCRNALIVGGAAPPLNNTEAISSAGNGHANSHANATATTTAQTTAMALNNKQVSSRGSSGIGSDLAPSPERQDLNSSSDDEHWSNEADNSVIALKPSQIAMDRSVPIIAHHVRKSAVQPPEDSYLRDLPAKPYMEREKERERERERSSNAKTPSWSREDEIKPIIVRPQDYDAKFNRVLQAEQALKNQHHQHHDYTPPTSRSHAKLDSTSKPHAKLHETEKYNEINRLLNKKLLLDKDRGSPDQFHKPPRTSYSNSKSKIVDNDYERSTDDFDESDPDQLPHGGALPSMYRKENLTDKQKFIEYTTKKHQQQQHQQQHHHIKSSHGSTDDVQQRFGIQSRQRYVDPADLPFEQPTSLASGHNKYAAIHRGVHHPATHSSSHSPERSDFGHRTAERHERHDRQERQERQDRQERRVEPRHDPPTSQRSHSREPAIQHKRERDIQYSRSKERNPYREAESLPYIQSMEKMMKSSAMRYKSFDGLATDEPHSYVGEHEHIKSTNSTGGGGGGGSSSRKQTGNVHQYRHGHGHAHDTAEYMREHNNVSPRDRFKDAKDKFRAMERPSSRYDLERDNGDYKARRRGSLDPNEHSGGGGGGGRVAVYEDWSDDDDIVNDVDDIDDADDNLGMGRVIDMNEPALQSVPLSGPPSARSRARSRNDGMIWHDERSGGGNVNIRHEPPRREPPLSTSRRDLRDYNRHDNHRPPSSLHSARDRDVCDRRDNVPRDPFGHEQSYEQRSVSRTRLDREREIPSRNARDHSHEYRRDYSPAPSPLEAPVRHMEKSSSAAAAAAVTAVAPHAAVQRSHKSGQHHLGEMRSVSPVGVGGNSNGGIAVGQKHLAHMPKGYRHSYAEPVFARSGGRVGLAAVNPY